MNIGLLLAAGKGERFKKDKAFVLIKGKPVIFYSLQFLEGSPYVDEVFIAVNKDNKNKIENFVKKSGFKKVKKIFLGGPSRFVSVTKVLPHLLAPAYAPLNRASAGKKKPKLNFLIIHNVANPLATQDELYQCINTLKQHPDISGVAVGRKIHSTIKKATGLSWEAPVEVEQTVPRQNLWEVETPQVVRAKDFLRASSCAMVRQAHHDTDFTDDLSVLEAAGKKTLIVGASSENRKLTRPEDIELLRFFAGELPKDFLVGIGEDAHRFSDVIPRLDRGIYSPNNKPTVTSDITIKLRGALYKRCLVLGGIKIKTLPALSANSDGDVILHALCNAISSALGGGSLGTYATKMCKTGIRDSKKYLEVVLKKTALKKYKVLQCSISIEAKKPNIDSLSAKIKDSLGALLKISANRVGITATSGEGLTPFGLGEAIKCTASVLLCVVK